MRVGVFGNFYPISSRAGSASTGMVTLLARSKRVDWVIVFAPVGSTLPPGLPPQSVQVRNSWAPDRPFSLVRCLLALLRARSDVDLFVFSIYPTSFGRGAASNGLGMLLPSVLAQLSYTPVVVYMHNFLETQQVDKLGYRPGTMTRFIVRTLERWIVRATVTVVPLQSMRTTVERELGGTVVVVPLPYVEAVYGALTSPQLTGRSVPTSAPAVQVLLFGTWGPQKDLEGAVRSLLDLATRGVEMQVTIAGDVNPNFPAYEAQLNKLLSTLPRDRFLCVGHVPEESVFSLVAAADALFLPYRAAGGYSGVMNCAGLAGTPVVAYDVPQLREFARLLGLSAEFVTPGDGPGLESALRWARSLNRDRDAGGPVQISEKLREASEAIERMLDLRA